MSDLLTRLLSFPPHPPPPQPLPDAEYDKQIRGLVTYLNSVSAAKLVGGVPGGGDLLDILDPSIHTLPYLWTLLAHASAATAGSKRNAETIPAEIQPDGTLWPRLVTFLERFDPVQVRYAGQEYRDVISYVAQGAIQASKPLLAVEPLKAAILRPDPSSSTLTSTHFLFVQVCLKARAFRAAVEILDRPIFHIPSSNQDRALVQKSNVFPCSQHDSSVAYISGGSGLTAKLTYRDHLRYFLYGAMVYMALRQWKKALFFLEVVITTPVSNVTSVIQAEAYKKWVLVGLLLYGKQLPMPKTTGQTAAKAYRAIAKPYDALAEKFQTDASTLSAEIDAGQRIWQDDRNTGLVLQVYDAFRRFAVIKLGKTFAALSIPQVAQRTSPTPSDLAETERFVASLIAAGDLNATLSESGNSQQPAILRFTAYSASSDSEEALQRELALQSNDLTEMMKHVQDDDARIELSKEYIEYLRKLKRSKEAQEKDGGGPDDFDEDMMADLQ